ncbi:hypothetical protein cypCar_00036303 [Cyprinus carpio]|nr:hypothetical protein cypCar_00036303 [Cyprinus carpio]
MMEEDEETMKHKVLVEKPLHPQDDMDSDYLSVLFHLYDSDDDEEAERHKLAQLQRDERSRRQQERISSLRRQKQEFVPGFWRWEDWERNQN